MKNTKQLLIAAAVTSMSLNAMADITISGEAKVNSRSGDHSMQADLTITGKSGDTSVVAQIGLDANNEVEQLYTTSKVAGVDVKLGSWKNQKGELGVAYTGGLGNSRRIEASTSYGGVKLTYEDWSGAGGTKVAVAGKIGGVKTWLKKHDQKTEVKLSGSIGGIDIATHLKDYDEGSLDSSVTLKTSMQGLDFTYVNTTSDMGTNMDGFILKSSCGCITEANAFGASANILGNKITYKDIMVNGTYEEKLILNRKLASGATFEAIYRRDSDNPDGDWLDLELAVKF